MCKCFRACLVSSKNCYHSALALDWFKVYPDASPQINIQMHICVTSCWSIKVQFVLLYKQIHVMPGKAYMLEANFLWKQKEIQISRGHSREWLQQLPDHPLNC